MQGVEKRHLLATLALLFFLFVAGFTHAENKVVLSVDGKTSVVKTAASDVRDFLKEHKVTYQDQDLVFPPPSSGIEEGTHVVVKHAIPVIVELDDKKRLVMTTASTVEETVEELGVELEAADKITPELEAKITEKTRVQITRAISTLDSNRVNIPFNTVTQEDSSLLQGRAVVVQEGKEGLSLQIFNVSYLGDQEIGRELHLEKVLCAPVDEIVRVGTKRVIHRAKPVRVAASASSPVSVSRGGGGRTVTMKATAYSAGHGCGYTTATGGKAQHGVIAVDPKVIPLGTKVYVEGYGEAVAGDTGGAIKGNRVDLCYNSESECVAFGRQDVIVHVQE